MGEESLSKPSQSNPSSAASMTSSEIPQPKPENEPQRSESESPIHENPAVNSEEDSVEEEGECGFCLFMKAGGCKETFTEWEKCVDEGEKKKEDIVDKCFQATAALKKCMEAHSDYYAPLLEAEKAAEEEAAKQLEPESELEKKESEESSEKKESETS